MLTILTTSVTKAHPQEKYINSLHVAPLPLLSHQKPDHPAIQTHSDQLKLLFKTTLHTLTLTPPPNQTKMQLPTALLFLAALTSTASAWNLVLTMDDRRTATMHGTYNQDCKKLDFDMSSPVTTASFDDSTWADTFELYANTDCSGRVYRNGRGTYTVTPRYKVQSYKVY